MNESMESNLPRVGSGFLTSPLSDARLFAGTNKLKQSSNLDARSLRISFPTDKHENDPTEVQKSLNEILQDFLSQAQEIMKDNKEALLKSMSEYLCSTGDVTSISSVSRRLSRVASCQRCQRRPRFGAPLCSECQRECANHLVDRSSPPTFMCDDYKGAESDVRLHRSGGYNLTSVRDGQCLNLAISLGTFDWIRQSRTCKGTHGPKGTIEPRVRVYLGAEVKENIGKWLKATVAKDDTMADAIKATLLDPIGVDTENVRK
eukprot:6933628-Karenia_brevis.AAC.1